MQTNMMYTILNAGAESQMQSYNSYTTVTII